MIPRNQNSATSITTASSIFADPALIAEDNDATESMRNADALAALVTMIARSKPAAWVSNIPVRIRAMVRTGKVLFAAGPPDLCDPEDPAGALEGRKGAVLLAFDPNDGRKLTEYELAAPPVFDGLSAANGRLYLSATDGSVTCLSGNRETSTSRGEE